MTDVACWILAVALAGTSGSALAQSLVEPVQLPLAYSSGISSPVIDPALELKGQPLLDALRSGGLVLFMRHAHTSDPRPACPDEGGLTSVGEQQARWVGAAIKRLRVPIALVQASALCRAKDTAMLLGLGEVTVNAELNPGAVRDSGYDHARRYVYLNRQPPANANVLLVSHVQGTPVKQDNILIELAEVVVYRPVTGGRPAPVARIPVSSWQALLSLAPP